MCAYSHLVGLPVSYVMLGSKSSKLIHPLGMENLVIDLFAGQGYLFYHESPGDGRRISQVLEIRMTSRILGSALASFSIQP